MLGRIGSLSATYARSTFAFNKESPLVKGLINQ